MKLFVVLFASMAVASCAVLPATQFFRAPAHDSAIIRSDRLGGNFAYSVQEGHAYQAVSPVVQNVRTPVAVSYQPAIAPAHFSAPVVAYEAAKPIEVKYAAPAAHYAYQYAAPAVHYAAAPAPIAYEAPKFEVKEAKPIEIKYTAPEVKYFAAPHHVVYSAPAPVVKAAAAPAQPLIYYDAPKTEVTESKVEYSFVAPAPYAHPSYAHAVAI